MPERGRHGIFVEQFLNYGGRAPWCAPSAPRRPVCSGSVI